jgi:nitrogen fixation protein FixH
MCCVGGFILPTNIVVQKPEQPFTLKGWHVLVATVAFFAVVGTVNGIMITQAIRTMPGADVKSAYEASQRFNTAIADARTINAHGISGTIFTDNGTIAIDPQVANHAAVLGLAMTASLDHPADKSRDLTLHLTETRPGHYETTAIIPVGYWNVKITALRSNEAVFRTEQRLMIGKAH